MFLSVSKFCLPACRETPCSVPGGLRINVDDANVQPAARPLKPYECITAAALPRNPLKNNRTYLFLQKHGIRIY